MPNKKYTLNKKQSNSNNFIRNTYCKIYFSFIVGNILSSDMILTPPPVLTVNVGSYHSLIFSGLSCCNGPSFCSGSACRPAWLNMWESSELVTKWRLELKLQIDQLRSSQLKDKNNPDDSRIQLESRCAEKKWKTVPTANILVKGRSI